MKQRTKIIFLVLLLFGFSYEVRDQFFHGYLNSAENFYRQNKTEEALTDFLYASALDENSSTSDMKLRRAEIFYENKNFNAVRSELAGVAHSGSRNLKIYKLLGKTEIAEGNFQEADSYYEEACKLDGSTDTFLARIKELVRGGNADKAEELLKNEKVVHPGEDMDYYLGLVRFSETEDVAELSSLENGSYRNQIQLIEKAYPDSSSKTGYNPDYLFVKEADAFNKINEPDFAFAALSKVLKTNNSYCDAWVTMGKTFLIENEYSQAADAFQRCAEIDANNKESFFWLSGIYKKLGNTQKAAGYTERYDNLVQ